jgi:hypothetical protein
LPPLFRCNAGNRAPGDRLAGGLFVDPVSGVIAIDADCGEISNPLQPGHVVLETVGKGCKQRIALGIGRDRHYQMGDLGQICVQIPAWQTALIDQGCQTGGLETGKPLRATGGAARKVAIACQSPGDGKAGKSGAKDHQSHRFTCFLTRWAG